MHLDVSLIKSVLTIYDELLGNGIYMGYLGEFNHEITKMFTTMAEEDMERAQEKTKTIRRVYHVMVETLQNLNRHSDELAEDADIGKGLFMIGKQGDSYYIITANRVGASKKAGLEATLIGVNQATREELKEMYKRQIKEGKLSEKGGAGLGLIDIARKTTSKLDFQFIPFSDGDFLFILKVELNTKIIGREEQPETESTDKASATATPADKQSDKEAPAEPQD